MGSPVLPRKRSAPPSALRSLWLNVVRDARDFGEGKGGPSKVLNVSWGGGCRSYSTTTWRQRLFSVFDRDQMISEENCPVVLYGSDFSSFSHFLVSFNPRKPIRGIHTISQLSSVHTLLQHRNEGLAVPRVQERLSALGTKREETQLVTANLAVERYEVTSDSGAQKAGINTCEF